MITEKMCQQDPEQYLVELFARAGKGDNNYKTNEERYTDLSQTGAQVFKRRALGLCGRTSIKSLDEFSELLQNTNIASSLEEAKELVPKIVDAFSNCYTIKRGMGKYLRIDEVKDSAGNSKYRITASCAD